VTGRCGAFRVRRGAAARLGLLVLAAATATGCVRKKLIEWGWDEPDTAYLRRHIARLEETPFDGCVFGVRYRAAGSAEGSFTWKAWGRRAFTEEELRPALLDLRATRTRRFRHNFLRFNTTPADIDWFDDFSAVLQNARLAARVAREGGARGIALDDEQYEGPLFEYARQRDAGRRSWNEYSAQARRRGRELMQAFEQGYPGVTVFLTFGSSLPFIQMERFRQPLADVSYGLLAPFLDGMVEGVRSGRLIDGYELSYAYKKEEDFAAAYDTMSRETLRIVEDPERYRQVTSFGFGIWMDYRWRQLGWNTTDPSRNYFSPEAFERSVRAALVTSDEWVWIYSETPRWWTKEGGGPVNLPAAYDAALRRALLEARTSGRPPRPGPPPAAAPAARGAR
jgi:hypothetical protein